MAKKWIISPNITKEFQDRYPELRRVVLQLLYNRSIKEPQIVDKFLAPDYHNLHSPFLFQEMNLAVDRIWQAILSGEKILVFGDYDADAVTANAVLQQTFRYLGVEISSYIPDRFSEGYGLSVEAFQKIKDTGVSLVITVDCGTNSVDVAEFCRDNGIDLIITDHHEITGDIPQAFALVNPKNPNDSYPDNQITGVGVAYKLAKAILSDKDKVILQLGVEESEYNSEWDKWLLDLVAIGTVADCHSLLGENRILVKFGLKVLTKTKWIGLRQLVENAGLDLKKDRIDSKTLGFTVAPRINAAGRLEHADIALNLLITQDFAEAITQANRLEDINRRRQDLTKRIISEAKEQAEQMLDRKVLVLYNPAWPKGLVGIVAGKLAELYKRPVFVLEKGEVESTGSARTGIEFDLVDCLKSVAEHLAKFGGHKQAAGLTVETSKLEDFYKAVLEYAENNWVEASSEPTLDLEAQLFAEDLSFETYAEIENLEPFGAENPKPYFAIHNAQVAGFKTVGSDSQHLQLQLQLEDKRIDTIGFNLAYLAPRLSLGTELGVAGELIVDSWNGTKKLKMKLLDIQIYEYNQTITD